MKPMGCGQGLLAGMIGLAGVMWAAPLSAAPAAPPAIATPPVYVPDLSHQNEPLPNGVLVWDSMQKTVETNDAANEAEFVFNFTNVSGGNVVFLDVHPSCGCTTAHLPPLPWTVAPGAAGQIAATVNIAGKIGTLIKAINITTDKGRTQLTLVIKIVPAPLPTMSEAERQKAVELARIDRQAVFKNNCATCHVQRGQGKYGEALYQADCAICHESERRASFVPDLHDLKVPTNLDFWRTWIAHGKPGTFMPAFAQSDGGPLTDMQIASLAAYLNAAIPSKVPPPQ
jgi:mono/diheme cytochrome c family protein